MAAGAQMSEYRRKRDTVDVDGLLLRLADLRTKRYNWDTHWSDVARRIWPSADEFTGRAKSTRISGGGEKRMTEIFDATGALALERFAAIMESINTPQHKIWHDVQASDDSLNEDPGVKAWFEQVNKILHRERQRPKANYQLQMQEGYKSLGAFGGLPLYLDENPSGGFRYKYCHVNQLYIELDHMGNVDTIYRVYAMTAHQAQQKWGDKAGEKVRTALADNKPYQTYEFLHAVYPRKNVDPESFDTKRLPWVNVYIAIEDKHLIEEGGFEEMPYFYARWTVNPSEVYGRSPAMMALPHIKTANQMQRTFLSAGHKAVDPPLLLPDEGVWSAQGRTIDIRGGGLTYGGLDPITGRKLIEPLYTGARLDLTETMLETERAVIKDWFLVTLFRTLLEDPRSNVTATEILQRAQEKGDIIAPQAGRLKSELYGPQIQREVGILLRQGRLPPPPPALLEAGGEYEIEYVSEAARLQKSREVLGIRSTFEFVTAASAIDPAARFVMDMAEASRRVGEYEGTPSDLMRTPDQVAQMMAQEAEKQQAAEQLAIFQQGAAGAKDATAALAQAAQAGQTRSATPGAA